MHNHCLFVVWDYGFPAVKIQFIVAKNAILSPAGRDIKDAFLKCGCLIDGCMLDSARDDILSDELAVQIHLNLEQFLVSE